MRDPTPFVRSGTTQEPGIAILPTPRGAWAQTLALALFTGMSLAFVALFLLTLAHGYRLGIGTAPASLFALIFGLVLLSVGLSIYLMALAERGLAERLAHRWAGSEGGPSPRATAAPAVAVMQGGPHPVLTGIGSVLFFAEAMTLTLSLVASMSTAYFVTIATNVVGEFWLELPLVVGAAVLSPYLLYRTSAPALGSAHRNQEVPPFTALGGAGRSSSFSRFADLSARMTKAAPSRSHRRFRM